MKKKNLAFTLAEVLIVIGIIGVVAALTLPNLNHATGDKEAVTRLQKAYSILNEANDRAVAIYGPVSTWTQEKCGYLDECWMRRIGEFLKISKSCDETDIAIEAGTYSRCNSLYSDDFNSFCLIYQLPDGITFYGTDASSGCKDTGFLSDGTRKNDICLDTIDIDINGPQKGKNKKGQDIFRFMLSDDLGILPYQGSDSYNDYTTMCMENKDSQYCSWWPLEFGNLDYLKADSEGKCNDSNIILDGTTNTSCH